MGTPGFSVKCQCKESGYVEWTLSTWHYLLKSNVLVGGNIYNGILGKDEPKMFYLTLVDAWGQLITYSSRLTLSSEETSVCL